MARGQKDPLLAYDVRFKSGSKRQRKNESRKDFLLRVQKTFPRTIHELEGNFECAALAYNVDTDLLEAMIFNLDFGDKELVKKCRRSWQKARAIMGAAKYDGKDKADEYRKAASEYSVERDNRLKRKHWPTDEDEREEAIKDALSVSIIENEGNMQEVSLCLNVPLYEILELVEGDEELEAMKERGMRIAVYRSEAALTDQAKSGNVTAIKQILHNKASDEWSDRQNISVKHEGFAPPKSDDAEDTVLAIINGGKSE